jgi:hypothetical protein
VRFHNDLPEVSKLIVFGLFVYLFICLFYLFIKVHSPGQGPCVGTPAQTTLGTHIPPSGDTANTSHSQLASMQSGEGAWVEASRVRNRGTVLGNSSPMVLVYMWSLLPSIESAALTVSQL